MECSSAFNKPYVIDTFSVLCIVMRLVS